MTYPPRAAAGRLPGVGSGMGSPVRGASTPTQVRLASAPPHMVARTGPHLKSTSPASAPSRRGQPVAALLDGKRTPRAPGPLVAPHVSWAHVPSRRPATDDRRRQGARRDGNCPPACQKAGAHSWSLPGSTLLVWQRAAPPGRGRPTLADGRYL